MLSAAIAERTRLMTGAINWGDWANEPIAVPSAVTPASEGPVSAPMDKVAEALAMSLVIGLPIAPCAVRSPEIGALTPARAYLVAFLAGVFLAAVLSVTGIASHLQ